MPSLSSKLKTELQRLDGTSELTTIAIAGTHRSILTLDLESVESVSSLVLCLTLETNHLRNADARRLEDTAERICSQLTYLLEDVGPLEIDPTTGQVLVRSTTPTCTDGTTEYYEILLRAKSGSISLQRFAWSDGQSGRRNVPLQLTHEVLLRLVDDLEDAVA